MIPSPELSPVWIFYPSRPLFQQESGTRRNRKDGNLYLSITYGRYWMALDEKSDSGGKPQVASLNFALLCSDSKSNAIAPHRRWP
jgi:hypothetical protein